MVSFEGVSVWQSYAGIWRVGNLALALVLFALVLFALKWTSKEAFPNPEMKMTVQEQSNPRYQCGNT